MTSYPPDAESITAADRVLIERVEGVADPFKLRELLMALAPDECARLVALGYASVDALKWPGPAKDLPALLGPDGTPLRGGDGEPLRAEPWPLDHRDAVLAAEQTRGEQAAIHDALARLGDDPPGMAPVLAGTDDVDAAVAALPEVEHRVETTDDDGQPVETVVVGLLGHAHVDGWLFVKGATDEQVAQALAATRP